MIQCPHCNQLIDPPRTLSRTDRFWGYVRKTDTCWEWIGTLDQHGYGSFSIDGKPYKAHRISYEWANDLFGRDDALFVCHTCDNRCCVNPDHLFLGTAQDNVDDMYAKGRGSMGEKHPLSILTEQDVLIIRAEYSAGVLYAELAARFGVSRATIRDVVKGYTWSRLPGADSVKHTGTNARNAKLNATVATEIRNLREQGMSYGNLAKKFGVSVSTIRDCLSGKTWKP